MAVAADALVLRHTQADSYLWSMKINVMLHSLEDLGAPPEIVPPIYFHYVDKNRVESLYNQLEPELEVKEREVTGKSTLNADATAGVGAARIGVEAGSESGTKSIYSPANLLTDRKCVAVMRYVRHTWPDNYFGPVWVFRRAYLRALKADKQAQSWVDPSKLTPIQPLGDSKGKPANTPTDEDKRTHLELVLLHGYIFIDGDFDQSVSGKNVILASRLTPTPFKCWFRVFLPTSASQMLPKTKPLHLRVFGDVTRPLGDDGFIDVAAIAVY